MLTGRPDLQSAQLREQGYRQALADGRHRRRRGPGAVGDYDAEVSQRQARTLLTGQNRPTAVFAANDMSAIATMETAAELGLRVPADLSVVGFDNIPESALCSPPLTTVSQPVRQMGQRSIELLLQLIRGEPADVNHITLATDLVVRQSTQAL